MGALVDDFLDRLGRGERPDVEDYARRYPPLAGVLRQMLPALQAVHCPAAERPALALEPEGPLGDFRLVRELGRGGMGVVYEAVQISLGRRVALKVLPFAAALDTRQLRRFQNEAQAAAHQHHPNIVPVYAVGVERGVHYYAMQLIEGQSLATLIGELRQAAGKEDRGSRIEDRGSKEEGQRPLPAQQAETKEDRGPGTKTDQGHPRSSILDPRSSILDPRSFFRTAAQLGFQAARALEHAHGLGVVHRDVKPANLLVDGQGQLWVTDFGLARVQSDPRLTLTGDLLGTLRYMSPEQALARPVEVDQRTDIYSLGATLYELLTLEPAFAGCDRQELLRQIAFEEPRPPRQLRRAVPVELETIVLKALAKAPAERYATAQELADDLDRFLKDEPVLARRPTLLQRARKWARRHRPVVWSAAVALLVALAVLAGSVGWVMRDRAAQQARTAAEVRAARQEARRFQGQGKWPEARAAARRAQALLDSGGGGDELRRSVHELRDDLRMVRRLEEIRTLRSRVKDGHFDDEGADRRYAAAFHNYGMDVETLDPSEAARRIAARAIRVELAAALDDWARTRRWYPQAGRKDWRQLLAVARSADRDRRRTALRDAVLRGDRRTLVRRAAADLGPLPPVTLVLLAEYLEELVGLRAATRLLGRAQERHPGDFWINHHLAYNLGRLGPRYRNEAIRFYTAAVALRPESPGARLNLGVALMCKGRRPEALAAFRRATELKPDYAEAHCNLGKLLWETGRHAAGIAALRRAVALKPHLAEAQGNLGAAFLAQGRLGEAAEAYRQAVKGFARRPGTAAKANLALSYNNLGHVLVAQGRPREAIPALRKALALRPAFADAHDGLGKAWARLGRLGRALAAYRRSIALKPDLAEAHCNLGVTLDRLGRREEAVTAYRRAVALKPNLVTAQFNLGLALTEQGRLDEAVTALRKVIALQPDYPMAYYDLGRALGMQGRQKAAAAAYRRAIALKPDYAEAHCNLGDCLVRQGQFARALVALKRGHELGSRRRDWPYPSLRWVRDCRRLKQLSGRLPTFLADPVRPAGAAEQSEYAWLCYYKKFYVAAARLWAGAFTADPKLADDLRAGHRYQAACAAGLAGTGKGKEAARLTAQERGRWRRQALAWLRADLSLRLRQLEGGRPKDQGEARQRLRQWQWDPDLTGLRAVAAVARLPAGEREAWRRLWAEVQAVLAKAGAR
jgi:serine/threonine protein kinase/Flp pilus assembly protein TadD